MAAFVDAGYRILIPFGENHRYDFVAEDQEGRFLRIQVKSGRLKNGAVEFSAFSSHFHRGGAKSRAYHGEIDYFAVYCKDNDQVYFVPEPAAKLRPLLRISPPKNNMKKTIVWADRFTLPPHEQARDDLKLWN